jgi:uncharacterized protein YndB with AHSA1/START domain
LLGLVVKRIKHNKIYIIMTDSTTKGKATTIKKTFSRETAVAIDINADKAIVWALLTNASDFPRWNSTLVSIQGTIAKGEKLRLISTLDPKRVFKLSVKEFDTNHRLVWGDAMGKRIYTLSSVGNGTTQFSMNEKIGGPLFPLFAKMIPPFDEAFEQFAKDLKKEAETISTTK